MEYEIQVSFKITDEDIDDIMCAALEGGITYWCWKAEVVGEYLGEYASDQISRGGMLKLYDSEQDEKYWLNREKFLKGVKLWIECCGNEWGAVQNGKIDCSMIDAIAADQIVQFALFDDVIFG